MKITNTTKKLMTAALAAAMALSITSCAKDQILPPAEGTAADITATDLANGTAGTILLSVNPEIEIEYDNSGAVVEIEKINDDAKALEIEVEGLRGKQCDEVLAELVRKIGEAGYFAETVDGKAGNIVVKLAQGSRYPGENFLREIEDTIRIAVGEISVDASPVVVDNDDLDDKGYIGIDKAKEIVLSQLDLTGATFNDHEQELDDGKYEFEFKANGVEYEYEVDARTGKVIEADIDKNDDWDDRGNWDDWKDVKIEFDDNAKVDENKAPADGFISLREAKDIALKHAGVTDAVFVEREQELDDGKYELEFTANGTEYEYEVDARSGAIREVDLDNDSDIYDDDMDDRYDDFDDRFDDRYDDRDDQYDDLDDKYDDRDDRYDDDRHDDIPSNAPVSAPAEVITVEEAKQIALKHAGVANATFTEREQELDDGKYEIEFRANGIEYEYEVDALTGAIREVDLDNDGDIYDDYMDDKYDYDDDHDDRDDDDWDDDRDDDDWDDDRDDDDWDDDRDDDDWDDDRDDDDWDDDDWDD